MEPISKLNAAIYRNMQSIVNYKLKDLSIRSGQHDFLYVISNNEGISQKELSEHLYIGKSTTAKAVKNLLTNGYIKKEKDENDKRYDRLYLTEKGKEVAPQIQKIFSEIIDIVIKNLSSEEAEQTMILLKKILSNVYEEKNKMNANLE